MKICFIKKLKKDKNNRLVYIVIFCFSLAICMIIVNFYIVNKAADEVRKNIVDYFALENINDINRYKLSYDLTIFGNKTIDKYKVDEEYVKKDSEQFYFIFNTLDKYNNTLSYEVTNNSIRIFSEEQKSTFNIEDYGVSKINIYSLYTFLNIYYQMKNNECNCTEYIHNEEYEDFIMFGIKFVKNNENETNIEEYNKILDALGLNLGKLDLQVSKENMLPTRYLGYDINGKAKFEIIFNCVNFE